MPTVKRSAFIGTVRPTGSVRLLSKRRAWFDETQQGGQPGDQQQQAGAGKYNPATLEDAMRIIEALNKRVDEREAEKNLFAQRLKAIETAQQQQLAEQGNYKTLAEQHAAKVAELTPIVERAAALEGIIRDSNKTRIERVPEANRSLIPVDYPPERLQAWLNANEALLTKPPAANYDAGAGAGGGGKPIELTAEEKELAIKMGMTPEQYLAAAKKAGIK